MNKNFESACDSLFDNLERFFDELAARTPDLDADWQSDSVFCLALDEREILISSHPSSEEIWLSGPSGGFHFRFENGKWLDTRDKKTIGEKIAQALAMLGLNVQIPF